MTNLILTYCISIHQILKTINHGIIEIKLQICYLQIAFFYNISEIIILITNKSPQTIFHYKC